MPSGPEAQMPAIIAGAFPPAADPAWANWSKASLLRRSGEAVLRTGASAQIGFAGVAIAEQPVKELRGGGEGHKPGVKPWPHEQSLLKYMIV